METMELVRKHEEEMVELRRHIHQNPEISNAEFETTKLIREKLTEYGVEIVDIGLKRCCRCFKRRPSGKDGGDP